MKNQDINNKEWLNYIEKGIEPPNVVVQKDKIDTKSQLRAKYPRILFPTGRIIKSVSVKQCKAIRNQEQ